MKKFEFSLGRVLDFQNQMLDREKNELARMRQEKKKLEDCFEAMEHDASELGEAMTEKSKAGTTIFILKSYQGQIDGIRLTQRELKGQISQADEKIERQLEKVLHMTQEVSGLDKLKEHQWEDYLQAEAKASETAIAEFISSKCARQAQA